MPSGSHVTAPLPPPAACPVTAAGRYRRWLLLPITITALTKADLNFFTIFIILCN
jgi:hypothetical protein